MSLRFHSHIVGENAEAKAADRLIESFKKTAPKELEGEIIVSSNQQFYGYRTKDVDILIYCIFENYRVRMFTSRDSGQGQLFNVGAALLHGGGIKSDKTLDQDSRPRSLFINEVCATIEVKSHDARAIRVSNSHLLVKYREDFHSATEQASKQKYTVIDFFQRTYNHNPPVAGIVWLTELDRA